MHIYHDLSYHDLSTFWLLSGPIFYLNISKCTFIVINVVLIWIWGTILKLCWDDSCSEKFSFMYFHIKSIFFWTSRCEQNFQPIKTWHVGTIMPIPPIATLFPSLTLTGFHLWKKISVVPRPRELVSTGKKHRITEGRGSQNAISPWL